MKNRSFLMCRILALILCLALVLPVVPVRAQVTATDDGSDYASLGNFSGLTLSVLGDSISTYANVSNGTAATTTNSTITNNKVYYSEGNAYGVERADTWWQQTADALGMRLLVNNSWSGSCVYATAASTVGAYVDRSKQLHDDTGSNAGEKPDIIAIYLGTNDMKNCADPGDIKTLNLDSVKSVSSSYTPGSIFEAYALMLYRAIKAYPDAEIYCFTLLPYENMTADQISTMLEFNAGVAVIAEHFGAYVCDLYNDSGMTSMSENFDFHMANRLHPKDAGMDAISNCLIGSILKNSRYSNARLQDVSYDLRDVYAEYGTITVVADGEPLTFDLATKVGFTMDVTVTMNGKDITADCCQEGHIAIPSVTGPVSITAKKVLDNKEPEIYRWELTNNALISVNDDGARYNYATLTAGSCTDNVFTDATHSLDEPVILFHDRPWVVEWKSSGEGAGTLLLAGAADSKVAGSTYIFRKTGSSLVSIGYCDGTTYHNYGLSLADYNIDGAASHVYRMVNEVAADGSNMVYLHVDGKKLGALNKYYPGGSYNGTTSDWLNGQDLIFTHMGTGGHPISNVTLNYVQVWENGIPLENEGKEFRWETQDGAFVCENNQAALQAGSISAAGKFSGTWFELEEAVTLLHDKPWSIEWRSSGTWKDAANGAMLFMSSTTHNAPNGAYLYRRGSSDIIAFGERNGSHLNYGISLADHGIDGTVAHTYRLTNRLNPDGTNMIYLYVDGVELGAMNNDYVGGTAQGTTSNWVSGRDFTFDYMGNSQFPIGNCYLEYVQVWENGLLPQDYRWETQNDTFTSITDGFTQNDLTLVSGTISGSTFTTAQLKLDKNVILRHDRPWTMEWKSSGNWKNGSNGSLLFSTDPTSTTDGTFYLYRRNASNFIALGTRSGGKHLNYGVTLSDHGIDGTAEHTYRLSNRVNADGTNMVYLYVDGALLGPMNDYYVGSTAQGTTSDWVSGKDFVFSYMGTTDFPVSGCDLEYLQIWEGKTQYNDYRWETQSDVLTGITDGYAENPATSMAGSVTDGVYADSYYQLSQTIVLQHNKPWSLEWQSEGSWTNSAGGALLFSSYPQSNTEGNTFLYRRKNSTLIGLGIYTGGKYHNYGFTLSDYGIDATKPHVYRLTNHLFGDGSNMVYLYVDDVQIGPMNQYYLGGTAQGTTEDRLNGMDIHISYFGTEGHLISNCSIGYIQAWEDGIPGAEYRWETQNDAFVNTTGENENTLLSGTITDGVFSGTQYSLEKPITLRHDQPWTIGWQSEGTWKDQQNGGMLLSSDSTSGTDGMTFLYRRNASDFIAFGVLTGGAYRNYGIRLSDQGIDGTAAHEYLLANRVNADGTNMVYLFVDGAEVGPLNNYYSGGTDKYTKSDWISGRDFTFSYMGVNTFFIGNCSMDYLHIWESGAPAATVQFQNWDGAVLHSAQYAIGEKVAAPGLIPIRPSDAVGSYTFIGWNKQIQACSGDAVYTAVYDVEYADYTVEFQDYDGASLASGSYRYGDTIVPPADPVREPDATYTYTFSGWDQEVGTCIGAMTFTATYEAAYIDYIVQFVDYDGTVLSSQVYHYGDTVSIPENPIRVADESYTYEFAGWDREVGACAGDAVYTATYTATEITKLPRMTITSASLSFEDEIRYNLYYSAEYLENVVEMGLITFQERLEDGTIDNCVDIIPGYVTNGVEYMVHTNGIPAKNMGDALYFKVYAKLADGSYVYSDIGGYHAVAYAQSILDNSTNPDMKALVVAMLNYGAAAQEYFGYKTDDLMNAVLTAEQQALVEAYDESMVAALVPVEESKCGSFLPTDGAFSNFSASVSFGGAFSINYYFVPAQNVEGDMVMYWWSATTYNGVTELTAENADGAITMTPGVEYWAAVEGIPAKRIDETVYVAVVYSSGGQTYSSKVLAYSLGRYCQSIAADSTSAMQDLAATTAVYGYCTKTYFANK
ncbi:MAG: hypothetical protein IJV82_05090 [Oscillospiraceae bacterium]|nr:hypothetical protein [Oscillospiraceae bacterium]